MSNYVAGYLYMAAIFAGMVGGMVTFNVFAGAGTLVLILGVVWRSV